MNYTPAARVLAAIVALATAITCVGIAVLVFLNPFWVSFEQGRSNVTGYTGYTTEQIHQVTGSILSDLVFGPPSFDVTVNGVPVLDDRERGHMQDVRTVFIRLGLVAAGAIVVLVAIGLASRERRWFWRAAATGATTLAVGVVVVGALLALFFDQVFELFHEAFFPAGTYLFDPRTERLVQLFPDQFWAETSVALAAAVLGLALGTAFMGRRLAGRPEAAKSVALETQEAPL